MIGVALAAMVAVAAIHDTTSALPGTTLRFGTESGRFGAAQGFQPTARQQAPDQQERAGRLRFFGADAAATLSFLDRRLVQASFVIENASPRQIAYIDDDLTRSGYHRECAVRDRERSQCTWLGRTRVEIAREGTRITAVIRPLTADERGTARGARPRAAALADTMPMHPDTLDIPRGWILTDSLVESAPQPVYPPAAREAGVQGVVRLLAFVDTAGAVMDVRVTRSIAELDSAAVAVVRGLRFRPFVHQGRRVGAWVRIPVGFTLHGP